MIFIDIEPIQIRQWNSSSSHFMPWNIYREREKHFHNFLTWKG